MSTFAGADRRPALDRPRFNCPRCGAFAHQWWTDLCYPDEENNDINLLQQYRDLHRLPAAADLEAVAETLQLLNASVWKAAQCVSCANWSIWFDGQMVYPHNAVGAHRTIGCQTEFGSYMQKRQRLRGSLGELAQPWRGPRSNVCSSTWIPKHRRRQR